MPRWSLQDWFNVSLGVARIFFFKLCCQWRSSMIEWRDVRFLCLGLDGAGKTSLMLRAARDALIGDAPPSDEVAKPTTGFCVRTLKLEPDWKLNIWDIGGMPPLSSEIRRLSPVRWLPNCRASQCRVLRAASLPAGAEAMRKYWPKYATADTDALLWVVDGANAERLAESAAALEPLLTRETMLSGLPLLVLISKSDVAGATLTPEAVAEALGVEVLCGSWRKYHLQVCSAENGTGIKAGLRWLAEAVDSADQVPRV